jgi:hypothetical protein
MVSKKLIQKFMHAVECAEGSGVSGAVPTRANNPGNLTDDGDVGLGTIQTSGPFGAKITIYPTLEAGENALHLSSIGAGGMGEVYRACDTRLDRNQGRTGQPCN